MKILIQVLILSISLIQTDCQGYKEYLIKENLKINIPNSFVEMDVIELSNKYKRASFKPNVEFIDTQLSISLQITYGINPLKSELVDELRVSYETNFKELYPDAIWLETKTKKINSLTVGYLETMDKENYNLIFFTSLNNEQVHFVLQGKKEEFKKVQEISRKIMASIKK